MNEKEIAMLLTGGALALVLVYIASESAGHEPTGRELNTASNPASAQAYAGLDFGAPFKATAMLDISSSLHGWHPGYDPVPGAQSVARSRQRYPVHCGGNVTATLVRGMNPMTFNSPSDSWAAQPPSEVSL